uniref:hypothetical protein n=1 Tax=Algoriphagus sp. TaxID=1872435 RepID=UPI004048D899
MNWDSKRSTATSSADLATGAGAGAGAATSSFTTGAGAASTTFFLLLHAPIAIITRTASNRDFLTESENKDCFIMDYWIFIVCFYLIPIQSLCKLTKTFTSFSFLGSA